MSETKYQRRSIRLKEYDYSQDGVYFVTICVKNRENLFGKIENDKMFLNEYGKVAEKFWLEIPFHYPSVSLDEFVIMPNHLHGILVIKKNTVGAQNLVPLQNKFQKIIPRSLGTIIRGYKSGMTKWVRKNTNIHTIWHRNYYEHIIRDEQDWEKIRDYIIKNPEMWKKDRFYQNN